MNKKVYGFEIKDNDFQFKIGYMLYTLKKGFLKPALERFEIGDLFEFESMIECLKYNNINKLFTYRPNTCETICSAPYEINNDHDFNLCQSDGKYYRFDHSEIWLPQEKEKILNENKIQLIKLNESEISALEKYLKLYD